MAARRDFQFRETKDLALQPDAGVKLGDCFAFANVYRFGQCLAPHRPGRQIDDSAQTGRHLILERYGSTHLIE